MDFDFDMDFGETERGLGEVGGVEGFGGQVSSCIRFVQRITMGFPFNKDDIEFDAGQNIVVIGGRNIPDLEHGLVLELQRPQIQKLAHIFPQPIVKVHLLLKPAYCEIA